MAPRDLSLIFARPMGRRRVWSVVANRQLDDGLCCRGVWRDGRLFDLSRGIPTELPLLLSMCTCQLSLSFKKLYPTFSTSSECSMKVYPVFLTSLESELRTCLGSEKAVWTMQQSQTSIFYGMGLYVAAWSRLTRQHSHATNQTGPKSVYLSCIFNVEYRSTKITHSLVPT